MIQKLITRIIQTGINRSAINWRESDFFISIKPRRYLFGVQINGKAVIGWFLMWKSTIFFGRIFAVFFKYFAEIKVIFKTNQGGNLFQRIIGIMKQVLSFCDPKFCKISGKCLAKIFCKK